MESCSDESLLWTDVSNDEADDSSSHSTSENEINKLICSKSEKMSLTKSQKRIKEESLDDKIESTKKKNIKMEPESDNDSLNIKKYKSESRVDDSYLLMRVKEENSFLIPPAKIKKEKDKKKILSKSNNDETQESTESEENINNLVNKNSISSKTKKKLKQEKEKHAYSESEENSIIIDTGLDESISCKIKMEKDKKQKSLSQSHNENHRHTESEESIVNNNTSHDDLSIYKKKKKKKKKSESKNNIDVKDVILEEHFSAEETIVQSPHKKKKKKNKSESERSGNNKDQSFSQNEYNGLSNFEESQISMINSSSTHNDIHNLDHFEKKQDSFCVPQFHSSMQNSILPKKSSLRRSKISDRIQFEDDNTEDCISQDATVVANEESDESYSSKLNNYIKNTKLKPMKYKIPKHTLITEDDDIRVFKAPRIANIETLKDATLPLNKKFKTKIDGHTYECATDHDNSDVVILTSIGNKLSLKNIAIQSVIVCKKKIPKAHIIEDRTIVNNQTDFIPLPETKYRHPIFGLNYVKEIKIPEDVQLRLIEADTAVIKKEKKKKSKKRKLSEGDIKLEQPISEDVLDASHFIEKKKKKKKRKHSDHDNDDEVPKKKKRHKINEDSSALWDSEKAIEENLFNF